MKQGIYPFWLAGIITLAGLSTVSPAQGQIIPDATLPNNSQVLIQGNLRTINGGTVAGTNLFHSFRDFSVTAGTEAHFNNASTIQNIITRITGNSVSNIDGLLRTNGIANLFLLNPNGIIFGPNASLQIGGSFLASTAESLVFEDGTQFSTRNSQTPPLLTVSVPVGLQFNSNSQPITVQGSGHNLITDDFEQIDRSERPVGLSISLGKTLALVGGNVSLEGGNLTAESGRVEVASVVDGQLLFSNNSQLKINPQPANITFGDINLLNESSIDASGQNGEIQLLGKNILVQDGSAIFAITENNQLGGLISIKASDSIEVNGSTTLSLADDITTFLSGILSQAQGEQKAADIEISTQQLNITGGQIATSTYNAGDAGNLTVRASDSVILTGTEIDNSEFASGLFSQVYVPEAAGDGGTINIETAQLVLQDGANINTTTFGEGRGGNIVIRASELVEIGGLEVEEDGETFFIGSSLFSSTEGNNDAGDITIETAQLSVLDEGQISASTSGLGNAGNIFVRALDSVEVVGLSSGIYSQVNFTETETGEIIPATGSGGNINIETRQLKLLDGGQISTAALVGSGGDITVRATDSVELIGTGFTNVDGLFPSGVFTQVASRKVENLETGKIITLSATGKGGDLSIETQRLIIRDGGQASAGTRSEGDGGTLTVNATDFIELSGQAIAPDGEVVQSGLLVRSRDGSGDAGNLEINTNQLIIQDGATATVSSSSSTGANAGNLTINAPIIRLNRGIITAETKAGSQGNININTQDLQMRRTSKITTDAQSATGGNILINTDTLAALENSDISANAFEGPGGRVTINAQGIFGTEFREDVIDTPQSDITASSNLGSQFAGIVEINTPDIDPTQGVLPVPQLAEVDPPPSNPCAVVGSETRYINVGQGGLPPNPREALNLGVAMVNENKLENPVIEEAQGWIINEQGKTQLVTNSPQITPYGNLQTPACSSQSSDSKR
jgi:filamentous hemagglutinin family protein